MAKSDVKSAFRLIPTHLDDFKLMGFKFEGKHYFDKAMLIGCSVSYATWIKFSTFLEWLVKTNIKDGEIMHYLDDFLFVGKNDFEKGF